VALPLNGGRSARKEGAEMSEDEPEHARVLDPIERASEAIFGVLMAMTFTGSLSAATAAREEVRTMLFTALGCNIAWGLTDAVMYVVGTFTEKNRRATLLRRLRETADLPAAHRLIADELPDRLAGGIQAGTLEAIRKALLAVPEAAVALTARDLKAAAGVFALVVLATFPVVVPFVFTKNVYVAMRVSNGLAVATLYAYGHLLGKYSGGRPWRYGLTIAAVGMALVAIIMALGG
jgi:VIT1/CCC1 family predicted Fe2+/Mn2+ transporter